MTMTYSLRNRQKEKTDSADCFPGVVLILALSLYFTIVPYRDSYIQDTVIGSDHRTLTLYHESHDSIFT